MKFWIQLLTIFICSSLLLSCKKVDAGKGTVLDHFLYPNSFSRIELRTEGNIFFIENDSDSTLRVQTTPQVFDVLDIKVENEALILDIKNGYSLKNGDKINYYISCPNVQEFVINGIGNINIQRNSSDTLNHVFLAITGDGEISGNQMSCKYLRSEISGSGKIEFNNILARNTQSIISGNGDIILNGFSDSSIIEIPGVGNYDCFGFQNYHSYISFSGTANARVQVDSTLNVEISGFGHVYYKGQPTISSNLIGTGYIIDAN